MRSDRYTVKSQEALELAQRLARERGHQELRAAHLLAALLQESGGTVAAVLEKLGVPRQPLLDQVSEALDRLPKVQGGSMYMGESLRRVLDAAEAAADRLKDDYVSVEHLLMALAAPEPGSAARASRAGRTPRPGGCSRARASRRTRCCGRWRRCAAGSA